MVVRHFENHTLSVFIKSPPPHQSIKMLLTPKFICVWALWRCSENSIHNLLIKSKKAGIFWILLFCSLKMAAILGYKRSQNHVDFKIYKFLFFQVATILRLLQCVDRKAIDLVTFECLTYLKRKLKLCTFNLELFVFWF